MKRRTIITIAAVALAAIGTATGISIAAGGNEQPLTGSNLDTAVAAALAYTRGGTVTETEVGDDGAAYSVEIRLDDGSQVEVQLDARFNVFGQEVDDDGTADQEHDDASSDD